MMKSFFRRRQSVMLFKQKTHLVEFLPVQKIAVIDSFERSLIEAYNLIISKKRPCEVDIKLSQG